MHKNFSKVNTIIEELIFLSKKNEVKIETTTKSSEFVPSFHVWIEPNRQRKRADELAHITEKNVEDKK